MARRMLLCAAIASLAGCAARTDRPQPEAGAPLPPAVARLLDLPLPPATFGREATLDQLVTGTFEGRDASLRFRVEVTADKLVLVGLNPVGIPLFSLTYDGRTLDTSTMGGKALPFDPRMMLADFQMAFWPSSVLAPVLAARGLTLDEGKADGRRRILAADGQIVVDVAYARSTDGQQSVVLVHTTPPYSLRIRSALVTN